MYTNWHNAKLVRILQLHIVIGYMMLRPERLLLPNLLTRWKLSSVKLISKCTRVWRLSLDRQQSSKLVTV